MSRTPRHRVRVPLLALAILLATLLPGSGLAAPDYCDLTGDGIFDLADIGAFGSTFVNGPFDPRMDFNGDEVINMVDLAMLSDCLNN